MANEIVILTTCGSRKEASRIARSLVGQRLAACVNILQTPVESVYWWKGKMHSASEFLLIAKSSRSRFGAIEKEIRRLHSYDTPEIIAVPIAQGSRDYLAWLSRSVRPANKGRNGPA